MKSKKKRDIIADSEKSQILTPEKLVRERKEKQEKLLLWICLTIVLLVVAAVFAFLGTKALGKSHLQSQAKSEAPALPVVEEHETDIEQIETEETTEEEKVIWEEGWVRFNGQVYAYNEDMLTFLFMGIDKNSDVKEVAQGTNGGQADALFLLLLNPHDRSIKVLAINRNAITGIEVYDETGAYVKTVDAQICTQHGFGNGLEQSCEYQVEAVDRLLYNIPIHGYCAVNMKAIGTMADLIGGVEVTALEDVITGNTHIVKDEKVTLTGEDAFYYVKYRDWRKEGTADDRLARQKQFLKAFIGKMKGAVREDITLPLKVYETIKPQMVTNVGIDQITYLATEALGYTFLSDAIYTLPGETVTAESVGEKFDKFFVDEDALYELILELFYEEVEIAE